MQEKDKEALRIHGYVWSSDSDSGKSEFDEEYFNLLPPPVPLDCLELVHKICKISASPQDVQNQPQPVVLAQRNAGNASTGAPKGNHVFNNLVTIQSNVWVNGNLPKSAQSGRKRSRKRRTHGVINGRSFEGSKALDVSAQAKGPMVARRNPSTSTAPEFQRIRTVPMQLTIEAPVASEKLTARLSPNQYHLPDIQNLITSQTEAYKTKGISKPVPNSSKPSRGADSISALNRDSFELKHLGIGTQNPLANSTVVEVNKETVVVNQPCAASTCTMEATTPNVEPERNCGTRVLDSFNTCFFGFLSCMCR